MVNFIARHFVKDYQNVKDPHVRDNYGIVASIFGLVSNVVLFVLKLVVGFIFSSMSIISDALNNMADFGNSSVSLIGFKLSKKPGDKEHPYGHARIEYLASLIIAFVIVIVGVIACVESIHDVIAHVNDIHSDIPETKDLYIMIPLLAFALLVKLFQALLYRGFGKKIKSITFKGLFADSRNDMITTTGVIISILISYFTKINIDGYIGAAVSLLVIYSGVMLGYQTAKILIGEKPDKELIDKFIALVKSSDGVLGLHDLEMHCYGPNVIHASIHVEVNADENIMTLHDKLDAIERNCEKELGVKTVIHMDPVKVNDPLTEKYKKTIKACLDNIDSGLSIHDFRVITSSEGNTLVFDIRLTDKYKKCFDKIKEEVESCIKKTCPEVKVLINYDQPYEDMMN